MMMSDRAALGATSIERTDSELDRELLEKTLDLAELGRCAARPNPVVGAVLADSRGEILATGHHVRHGDLHAERECLNDAPSLIPDDATLYVSLEPCDHQGKTPPCCDELLARGVKRVVYASCDPNPATSGSGPARLVLAGVEVARGPADIERCALQQNAGFHSRHLRGRPYVTAKIAITKNGRFSTGDPQRRWISSKESREFVHYLRAGSGAIACGIGTVLADDPQLTVRGVVASRVVNQPLRVVFDRSLRMPLESNLVACENHDSQVLVITQHDADSERERMLVEAGVDVWRVPDDCEIGAPCFLSSALIELANRGVQDLLLEAGPTLLEAMHSAGLVDSLIAFVAPIEAPDTEPGLEIDSPLLQPLLASTPTRIGDDEQYVALANPAWEFPGAIPG